jgi:hypothetical protein
VLRYRRNPALAGIIGARLLPVPLVHPDLAAAAVLAVADEE